MYLAPVRDWLPHLAEMSDQTEVYYASRRSNSCRRWTILEEVRRGKPPVNCSDFTKSLENLLCATALRRVSEIGRNYSQDSQCFSVGNRGVPPNQFAMVSAWKWVHAHDPGRFGYDRLRRTIDSQARIHCAPIASVTNMDEPFSVYESCQPSDFVRVPVSKREFRRDVVAAPWY